MTLRIPLVEKVSANKIYAGMHWAVRKKIADKFHEQIHIVSADDTGSNWNYPVRLSFAFSFSSRPLDASNCFYMGKMLEDGLVKSGILADDSPKYVESLTISSKKEGNENMVEIRIEDNES